MCAHDDEPPAARALHSAQDMNSAPDVLAIALRSRIAAVPVLALAALGSGSLAAGRDASAATSCSQYPIPLAPASGAQSAAQAELAAMSPGATMTWNADTGTLTSVSQLAAPLRSCTAGQDVWAQVDEVLTAHPALFQLDMTEWQTPEPYDCQYLGDNEILSLGRTRLAGRPLARDVFAVTLRRVNGAVELAGVNGTYLPVVDPAMGSTMTACNTLTESSAADTARRTRLSAGVYSQCQRTGSVAYMPKSNDAIQFTTDDVWSWAQGTGQVLLTGQRTLRVVVDPSNYTPELMSSDARCPVPGGDGTAFTIGFDLVLDVHTGAILSVKPGLDCVVC